jgi:hypothetical protein
MAAIITLRGSEWKLKYGSSLIGATITIGLYNDATDQITYQHDMANISTEPSDGNYAAQTFTAEEAEGTIRWIIRNTADVTFDLTNTTQTANGGTTVDSWYMSISFDGNGDGGTPTEHLLATGRLVENVDGERVQKTLTLADETQLVIAAGLAGFKV